MQTLDSIDLSGVVGGADPVAINREDSAALYEAFGEGNLTNLRHRNWGGNRMICEKRSYGRPNCQLYPAQ